jgi:hypothetical protein
MMIPLKAIQKIETIRDCRGQALFCKNVYPCHPLLKTRSSSIRLSASHFSIIFDKVIHQIVMIIHLIVPPIVQTI